MNSNLCSNLNENSGLADALAVVRSVFKSILDRDGKYNEFYLHPLGFYYCRLFSNSKSQVRLHIWKRNYSKKEDLYIHDHYYDLCSWVLCGAIRDFSYSVERSAVPTNYVLYTSGYLENENIRTITSTSEYLSVSIINERLIIAPKKYFISRETFHSNEILFDREELSITLVYSYNYKDAHRPNIVGCYRELHHTGQDAPVKQSDTVVYELIHSATEILFRE